MDNNFIIRKFQVSDIFEIKVRKEQSEFYQLPMDLETYGNMLYNGYEALTLIDKHGKIVWILGMYQISEHVAEAYFLTGDGFQETFREAPKLFVKGLRDALHNNPFIRVQTWCKTDFPEAEKLIKVIGFTYEGTLRKASIDKQDIKIFSIIKDV